MTLQKVTKEIMDLIKLVDQAFANEKVASYPEFKAGDTITVTYRIKEGDKDRLQKFRGVVIQISGSTPYTRTFTIRKISGGVGVERIFPYQEALDAIRQPYSAKIAVHEGGIIGKGPGQSTQRYVVPDISEDYMFSFIIEEYGLLGGILVIFLYVSLMARATIIVRNCGNDLYAKLSVAGLAILITGQAFLHMFVNADIGPMTGQTLPLISHGNSAFLCFSLAFGIILSFSRIASRKIDREIKKAAPLVEMHEVAAAVPDTADDEYTEDELLQESKEYDSL